MTPENNTVLTVKGSKSTKGSLSKRQKRVIGQKMSGDSNGSKGNYLLFVPPSASLNTHALLHQAPHAKHSHPHFLDNRTKISSLSSVPTNGPPGIIRLTSPYQPAW